MNWDFNLNILTIGFSDGKVENLIVNPSYDYESF